MKLNIKAFALACGIIWGVGLMIGTWWIMVFEGATHERYFLGLIYRGYNISAIGSLLGLIYGFFDGLIGGALLAWLYNLLSQKMTRRAER